MSFSVSFLGRYRKFLPVKVLGGRGHPENGIFLKKFSVPRERVSLSSTQDSLKVISGFSVALIIGKANFC